jgi:hypothetical protein
MKTYSLELRHAPSKRRLNAWADNRLEPLRTRLADDRDAVDWAQRQLLDFARHRQGDDYQYVEGAVLELLPIGSPHGDTRRLGRWVCNIDGLVWRQASSVAD